MSALSEYYLNSNSTVVQLETCEISHPSFTQTYRVVSNAVSGVALHLEDGSTQFFDYYPLQITPTGSDNDLDQSMKVTLGDLGQLLPTEMDRCSNAGSFVIKPTLVYRTFRSDDLSMVEGPTRFVISNIAFNGEGATFQADAPNLNNSRTGELYDLSRFTPLRGF
jgi:hypothetical protein